MRISVVVPVFNRPAKAARAALSVLAQSGLEDASIEVVLVDDASDPPLRLAISDSRLRIVRLDRNAGPAAARNAGVRAASGDYLAFLDSDDVWLDGKLARQAAGLRDLERRQPDGLHASTCAFYYPDRRTGRLDALLPRPAATVQELAGGCWFAPGSTLVLARSAFDAVGPLDERLRRLEDLEWFIRLGQRGGAVHVVPFAGVVVAPSRSVSPARVDEAATLIEARFGLGGTHELPADARRRLSAYLALERGAACLFGGRPVRGAGQLLKSLWLKPRLRMALERFWTRGDDVPDHVATIYRHMIEG